TFFDDLDSEPRPPEPMEGARVLAVLGDSVTTDHISPAGAIKKDSPAGQWLIDQGTEVRDFNSYGSRRGNHEVMIRGTFANIRLRNALVEREGGFTRYFPDGEETTIYEAAMRYAAEDVPLIVLAGKEYGSGSSRDWAAKGASPRRVLLTFVPAMHQNGAYPRRREAWGLVPGQSRLRGRWRRHPSLATDAQAWARAVWTPCLPQPRPATFSGPANRRISG